MQCVFQEQLMQFVNVKQATGKAQTFRMNCGHVKRYGTLSSHVINLCFLEYI